MMKGNLSVNDYVLQLRELTYQLKSLSYIVTREYKFIHVITGLIMISSQSLLL